MKKFPKNKSRKSKKMWNLRYRIYALLVIIILSPLSFYASDKNIPENVTSLSYDIVEENIWASRLERREDQVADASSTEPEAGRYELKDGELIIYDKEGMVITEQLKRINIDAGFISSQPFVDIGSPIVISKEQEAKVNMEIKEKEELQKAEQAVKDNSLDSILPPSNENAAALKNVLVYDKYKIRVPIIYTVFEDLFEKKSDGSFDFSKPLNTDSTDSSVQKKLEQGIVHLAYTPQPGEIGNSYIIGHSSNYAWIDSPYNKVFAPINQKSQVGETFIIYDRHGRELKFKVFEVLKIRDKETVIAYKNFPNRRVVTLQTSILGTRKGRIEATHRWLTRGELILE
jgi:hypothetical protein